MELLCIKSDPIFGIKFGNTYPKLATIQCCDQVAFDIGLRFPIPGYSIYKSSSCGTCKKVHSDTIVWVASRFFGEMSEQDETENYEMLKETVMI